jgi:hypothetical protein
VYGSMYLSRISIPIVWVLVGFSCGKDTIIFLISKGMGQKNYICQLSNTRHKPARYKFMARV